MPLSRSVLVKSSDYNGMTLLDLREFVSATRDFDGDTIFTVDCSGHQSSLFAATVNEISAQD